MLDQRKSGLRQEVLPSLSRNELIVNQGGAGEIKPAVRQYNASKIDKFSFSGDLAEVNSETVVTAPRMVQQPALDPGPQLLENSGFDGDVLWTKGTGWTIANGLASSDATQAGDADLTQTPVVALVPDASYSITFTVSNFTAGLVTPVIGDVEGTDRGADGTFTETIVAAAGTDIDLRADLDFDGSVDNVIVQRLAGDFDVGDHVVLVADAVGDNQTGGDVVPNGGFDSDTLWTKGTGWTIAAGVASCDGTQIGVTQLLQGDLLVSGVTYQVTYTVSNYVAGAVVATAGATVGTPRVADGTYTENILANATAVIIEGDIDFVGDIDNVSYVAVPGKQWQLDASDIVGETDAVLVLDNIQIADSGVYTCDFFNGAGKTSSAAITIIVT